MNASEITKAIQTITKIKQPVFLWGPPGIGKSQVVHQCAKNMGLHVRDIRAVLLDPVDLRGLPRISDDGFSTWCTPDFLPREGEGILFLDELNAAPPLVQAACYQLVLDRSLGEYVLPEGWTVIAAGNRESDRAVTHRMPSALANRFVHLDFTVDEEDWLLWAQKSNIDPSIVAFIRFRPSLLHAFDPSKNEKAFPSPRSWEFASGIISASPDDDIIRQLMEGTVGYAAATEFMGFLKIWRVLPTADEILANPSAIEIDNNPAVLYATCEMLSRVVDDSNIDSVVNYASRLPAEFSVLLMRDAVRHKNDIVETKAFESWAEKFSEVLV